MSCRPSSLHYSADQMTTSYDVLMAIGGVLFLVFGFIDMISTTVVTSDGGGLVTRRTINYAWRAWRWVSNLTGLHISLAGAPILVMVFVQWLLALLLGWALLARALTPPAPLFDQVLSLLSLAIGRGTPPCDFPAWMAIGVGMSGVVLVSLTISYVIAVVGAIAYTRHVAVHLLTLGSTPTAVFNRSYAGDAPAPKFELHLISLTPLITFVATKTLAFPVIDVFQPSNPAQAISVRLGCVVKGLAMAHEDDSIELIPRAAEQPFLEAVDHLLDVHGYLHDDDDDDDDDTMAPLKRRLEDIERWVEQSGWSWPEDGRRPDAEPGPGTADG